MSEPTMGSATQATSATQAASASQAPLVLIVDDEEQMTAIISFALETQGLRTLIAADARSARKLLDTEPIELVVLDVMLPGESGIELCRSLRETSDVPVILLTALGEVDDRVAGLTAGADDYLTKPFSPRELALRAQAILRRVTGATGAGASSVAGPAGPAGQVLRCGPLRVDRAGGSATWDGIELELPETELRLLGRLVQDAGRAVPLRTLLQEVWGTSRTEGGRDMVKSMIYRLRQQMRAQGAPADLIEAVRGQGYRVRVLPSSRPR
ncbi:response regulator transcription factor [Brachybacterium sp. AOP42-B2-9]|uniref:response regulator transcription factor n=1 Tax=Brachybacterium sp. AOP42-B2-9 TaxID=3457672 RepID=UPI0040338A8F